MAKGDRYEYSSSTRSIKQVIEEPDIDRYWSDVQLINALNDHKEKLSSIPSYPAEALGNLPDKKILVEDVDFRLSTIQTHEAKTDCNSYYGIDRFQKVALPLSNSKEKEQKVDEIIGPTEDEIKLMEGYALDNCYSCNNRGSYSACICDKLESASKFGYWLIKPELQSIKKENEILKSVLREADEYLSEVTYQKRKPTYLNSIGAGSILHKKFKSLNQIKQ